ncbi:hypothetical protein [Advenella sp. FME57]|uniref:hypothetical protein n=1 Tax=Advenella sp. FME57 TaxID=2742604 RepID=UPI0018676656|nr:hypothetical protein [Advenella sp. FME57]
MNEDIKNALTESDRKALVQRHFDVAYEQLIMRELNFLAALELGQRLTALDSTEHEHK